MLADLRLALRALRRAPGFALAAVLCLALGVGANTAVFSAVRAVLLRPVATPELDRLVVVREDLPALKLADTEVAPPEVLDVAARREAFSHVGGYAPRGFTITESAGSVQYRGVQTLHDFFGVFRVNPQLGRLYTPDDARDAGRRMVVVLSDGFWRERFGADPGAVGRTLRLNDRSYTVVGVLPPAFRYPREAQLFVPMRADSTTLGDDMRGSLFVHTVARLRDGVSLEQARAVLAAEALSWRDRFPQRGYARNGTTLTAAPFVVVDAGQLRPVLLVLAGAVAIVLLVACANVASLQLVRAAARERELAVRAAVGAGRARLVRQPLAESLVLAAVGLAIGLVVGWALTRVAVRLAPGDQLALRDLRLDGAVLAATAAVAAVAALAAGAVPALRAARVDVRAAIAEGGARGGSAGRRRHGVLRTAVVVQGALSTLLLLGTGLLTRSLTRLLDAEPGFHAERVVTASVRLPFARYGQTAASNAFYAELLDRLRAAPGVTAAAVTSGLPLTGDDNSSSFRVIGRDTAGQGEPPHALIRMASAEYFRALGIPLLRGRTFGPQDDAPPTGRDAAMAFVIDETLARRYFPGQDPIGQRINQGPDGVIVGVVGAVRDRSLRDSTKATVYYNFRQAWGSAYTVVLRSTLADAEAARALRAAVRAMDPQVPVFEAATMPEVVRRSVAPQRLAAAVLAFLTLLTVTLAALGRYGVLAYVVAQRRRELGIRAALGAGAPRVAALVLGDGARLAGAGLAAGTALFLAGGRVLGSQLYGVGPRDPLTVAGGVALLGAVALLASWLPARRAARVDPAVALRAE